MHEASLAMAVLDIVKQEARRYNARKIVEVRLAIGPLFTLEWETFSTFFRIAARGSPAAGARLARKIDPADACCLNCGKKFALEHLEDHCPECGSDAFTCFGGRTFAVIGLEAAEEA